MGTEGSKGIPGCLGGLGSPLTRVMSREAAAALMCRLGWRMELLQSSARANVPTALGGGHGGVRGVPPIPPTPPPALPVPPHRATTRNWSICRSVRGLSGSHTFISIFCWFRLSDSPGGGVWGGSQGEPPILQPPEPPPEPPKPSARRSGISAWYLQPTLISPWSASSVFCTGSNTRE